MIYWFVSEVWQERQGERVRGRHAAKRSGWIRTQAAVVRLQLLTGYAHPSCELLYQGEAPLLNADAKNVTLCLRTSQQDRQDN